MTIIVRCSLLTALLIALTVSVAAWQTSASSEFSLRVYGDNGVAENLKYGNRVGSTFGVDSLQPAEYQELEPPPPSPGFDCIWILPPGRTGQWGSYRGLLRRDWRFMDGVFYEARRDTWALQFAQNDNPAALISFKWDDAACLVNHCDSIFLIDPSGMMGWPGNKLDMTTTDTLAISDAGERGITRLRIIKYGVKLPWCEDGPCVGTCAPLDADNPGELPENPTLSQNYPNPFNPSTTVAVEIPALGTVTVKVYDLLGREAGTIFAGKLEPGRYEFTWDALEQASGIYCVRLIAGTVCSTRKLVLTR